MPHADGHEFESLDAYLAYLKDYAGPIGRPWYKQVGPDRYELQTPGLRLDNPDGTAAQRVFTRAELEEKFGFSD